MSIQVMPANLSLSKDFVNKILSKFRTDKTDTLCQKDETILLIGSKLYQKLHMKKEKAAGVYHSIRSDMRILSKIYLEMEDGENTYGNAIDMFLRENFEVFCKAIDAVTGR